MKLKKMSGDIYILQIQFYSVKPNEDKFNLGIYAIKSHSSKGIKSVSRHPMLT